MKMVADPESSKAIESSHGRNAMPVQNRSCGLGIRTVGTFGCIGIIHLVRHQSRQGLRKATIFGDKAFVTARAFFNKPDELIIEGATVLLLKLWDYVEVAPFARVAV